MEYEQLSLFPADDDPDHIYSIWRPEQDNKNLRLGSYRLRIGKNRGGSSLPSFDLVFDPHSGKINPA